MSPEPGVFVYRGVRAHTSEWVELWRSADVFVFPSALETFGIVLLEALSFGVPVVSSRAGAASEVLGEGLAGVLLDRLTPDGLAVAIRGVFADPAATASRVRRGLARVAESYSVQANARRLADMLHATVGSGSGALLIGTRYLAVGGRVATYLWAFVLRWVADHLVWTCMSASH